MEMVEISYGATVSATQFICNEYLHLMHKKNWIWRFKTDDGSTNMSEPTGATTLLGNKSDDENGSITYRGNFWMNIWKWIDGQYFQSK